MWSYLATVQFIKWLVSGAMSVNNKRLFKGSSIVSFLSYTLLFVRVVSKMFTSLLSHQVNKVTTPQNYALYTCILLHSVCLPKNNVCTFFIKELLKTFSKSQTCMNHILVSNHHKTHTFGLWNYPCGPGLGAVFRLQLHSHLH